MKKTSLKLDGRFKKQVKGRIEGHVFDVGILQDAPHKLPRSKKDGLSALGGGPVRKKGRKDSGVSLAEVSESIRKDIKINFYQRPFKMKANREILRFSKAFLKSVMTPSGNMKEKKRVENLLQAIVRNPILRGDYGINAVATATRKGFNRLMIDTGQLFKGITAKVRRRNV
jgi:uncharacterized protein YggU (UPF0235/DUF167 family)